MSGSQPQTSSAHMCTWPAAAKGKWLLTYYIAAKDTPQGRMLLKDDALGMFDGTLFFRRVQCLLL
jgi:hypothetical protein